MHIHRKPGAGTVCGECKQEIRTDAQGVCACVRLALLSRACGVRRATQGRAVNLAGYCASASTAARCDVRDSQRYWGIDDEPQRLIRYRANEDRNHPRLSAGRCAQSGSHVAYRRILQNRASRRRNRRGLRNPSGGRGADNKLVLRQVRHLGKRDCSVNDARSR